MAGRHYTTGRYNPSRTFPFPRTQIYRARLKGSGQASWILFLLLLATAVWACLQHPRNLAKVYRDRQKGGSQVWWTLLLRSLITSAWGSLRHSCNLGLPLSRVLYRIDLLEVGRESTRAWSYNINMITYRYDHIDVIILIWSHCYVYIDWIHYLDLSLEWQVGGGSTGAWAYPYHIDMITTIWWLSCRTSIVHINMIKLIWFLHIHMIISV